VKTHSQFEVIIIIIIIIIIVIKSQKTPVIDTAVEVLFQLLWFGTCSHTLTNNALPPSSRRIY
jgi:hypothetical protein